MSTGADPGFDQGGGPDRERPKTAILGPQFCRILVLGPHFWWIRPWSTWLMMAIGGICAFENMAALVLYVPY